MVCNKSLTWVAQSCSDARASGGVFFLIDTFCGDMRGNINTTARIDEIARGMPGTRIALIEATDNDALREMLERAMVEAAHPQVDGFFLAAHGMGGQYRDCYDGTRPDCYYGVSTSGNGGAEIFWNKLQSVGYVLGPIIGRFSPGARIRIGGCDLMDGGTPEVKRQRMQIVADNLGLDDGTIYMSEGYDRDGSTFELIFQTPFYKIKFPANLFLFAGQASMVLHPAFIPITLAFTLGVDAFIGGYILHRSSGRSDEFYPSYGSRAILSPAHESFTDRISRLLLGPSSGIPPEKA